MTRKTLFRIFLGIRFMFAGNWAAFRFFLPKKWKIYAPAMWQILERRRVLAAMMEIVYPKLQVFLCSTGNIQSIFGRIGNR